jgi:hypothetical protein
MTTVVDPLGTPSVTFNRSGTTIVSVAGGQTAGSTRGGSGDEANPIPRVCETTVVMALGTTGPGGTHNILFRLPDDAEIGDVVEVYLDPASTDGSAILFPNVGEAIGNRPVSSGSNTDTGISVPATTRSVLRKVSASLWMPIGAV